MEALYSKYNLWQAKLLDAHKKGYPVEGVAFL